MKRQWKKTPNMFAADAEAVMFHFTDDNQAAISRAP